MPLVNPILWFGRPCSAFELVIFTIEACGICDHDAPMGWTYASHNMCELESFHESYSSGILPDKIFNTATSSNARSEWKVMHWRSGSRPWTFVFMPTDTMWNLSWKLLARIFNHSNNSSGVVNWITCSYGFDHANHIQYIWKETIPLPRLLWQD